MTGMIVLSEIDQLYLLAMLFLLVTVFLVRLFDFSGIYCVVVYAVLTQSCFFLVLVFGSVR